MSEKPKRLVGTHVAAEIVRRAGERAEQFTAVAGRRPCLATGLGGRHAVVIGRTVDAAVASTDGVTTNSTGRT